MSFFDSWHLFAQAWLAAWCAAPLLALLGVAVLARQQVLLGLAMGQAATAGAALALVAGAAALPGAGALAAALGAGGSALLVGGATAHREGRAAWVHLAAGAATPLLLAHSAHGLDDLGRLVGSTIIGATWTDAAVLAAMLLAALAVVAWRGAELRALLLDPEFAAGIGVGVARWRIALDLAVGLAVGWALHAAGLLFTVGCLLLPGLIARQLARELRTMALIAPLAALGAALAGSVLADALDLPPGQVVVALLAAGLPPARLLRARRNRRGTWPAG